MEESEGDNDKQNEESTADASQGNDDEEPADLDATPRIRPKRILSPTSSQFFKGSDPHTTRHRHDPHQAHGDADIAGLTQSLNSLSLVSNSVRFGGGKARGFASDSPHRGGTRGTGKGSRVTRPVDADAIQDTNMHGNILPPPFRGRGIPFRGRGRGRAEAISRLTRQIMRSIDSRKSVGVSFAAFSTSVRLKSDKPEVQCLLAVPIRAASVTQLSFYIGN